jgi:hypothetical protein
MSAGEREMDFREIFMISASVTAVGLLVASFAFGGVVLAAADLAAAGIFGISGAATTNLL